MNGSPRQILITGASGFVGGHLIAALRRSDPQAALVATSLHDLPQTLNVAWRALDITDRGAVEALLEEIRPHIIVHLAALATYSSASQAPDLAWKVNVFGTQYLAEAALRIVPKSRLLHISSGEVYGYSNNHYEHVSEETRLDPGNIYAVTKASADLAIGEMTKRGLNAIRVRPFNHTGPGQGEGLFVPAVAAQIARAEAGLSEPIIRLGNLETKRDLLDICDVIRAYILILRNWEALRPGMIFNIASGEAFSMRFILQYLLGLSRVSFRIEQDPTRLRPSEVPCVTGDATALHNHLGWRPLVPLTETLEDVLNYWRKKFNIAPGKEETSSWKTF